MTGRVLWFNERKGYGFAEGEDGKYVYLHKSQLIDLRKPPEVGSLLEFEIEPGERCRRAVGIKISPGA